MGNAAMNHHCMQSFGFNNYPMSPICLMRFSTGVKKIIKTEVKIKGGNSNCPYGD